MRCSDRRWSRTLDPYQHDYGIKRGSAATFLRLALIAAAIAAWIWVAVSYLFFAPYLGMIGSVLLGVGAAVLSAQVPGRHLILLFMPAIGLLIFLHYFVDFKLAEGYAGPIQSLVMLFFAIVVLALALTRVKLDQGRA
jgi:hypothetical protein